MVKYSITYTDEIETDDSLEKIKEKLSINPYYYGTDMWDLEIKEIKELPTSC